MLNPVKGLLAEILELSNAERVKVPNASTCINVDTKQLCEHKKVLNLLNFINLLIFCFRHIRHPELFIRLVNAGKIFDPAKDFLFKGFYFFLNYLYDLKQRLNLTARIL